MLINSAIYCPIITSNHQLHVWTEEKHHTLWLGEKPQTLIFWFSNAEFPIDTPLVLRLVKTHMGKCLFSPELKSYLITQWNCTTIGSCRCRKTNQWVGSGAARTYGDDTRQYSRRNGRGIWLYKRSFRHRILRFFLLQRRRLRLRWSREAYSPLTRLAVGPSDLDLLGWSAFNAPQHRSSSGPVRCRYPAIT